MAGAANGPSDRRLKGRGPQPGSDFERPVETKAEGNMATASDTERSARFEAERLGFDWFKHLTTLSTGALLLLVTFLEKLFVHPLWRPLIGVAVVGFIGAVLGSLLAMAGYIYKVRINTETPKYAMWGSTLAMLGFVGGPIALAIFALRNLYA